MIIETTRLIVALGTAIVCLVAGSHRNRDYVDLGTDVEALLDGTLARERLDYIKERAAADPEYSRELDAAIDAEWAIRRACREKGSSQTTKPGRMSMEAKEAVIGALRDYSDRP